MKTTDKEKVMAVLIEDKKGKSISEIARKVNATRRTVYRYLNVRNDLFEEKELELSREELNKLEKQAEAIKESLTVESRDNYGYKLA